MSDFKPKQTIYLHAVGFNLDGSVDMVDSFDSHCFFTDKDAAVEAIKADDCEGVLYEVRPIYIAQRGVRRLRSVGKK